MSLTNYMSSILSEVQQFGQAYVDSLVAPRDKKDHEPPGTTAPPLPLSASTHRARGDSSAEHGRNFNSSITSSNTHSVQPCGVVAAAHDKGRGVQHQPGALAGLQHAPAESLGQHEELLRPVESVTEGLASSLSSSAPLETVAPPGVRRVSLRKHAVKAGRAPRSKFGAVRIEPEPGTANVTQPAAGATSASVDASPQQSEGENAGGSSQLEEKPVATVVEVASGVAPLGWGRWPQSIQQLLGTNLERRRPPAGSEWAQDALSHFAMKVAVETLVLAARDPVPSTASVLSSSVAPPSEGAWRHTDAELRRSVRRAIPREVFGLYASDYDNVTAANLLVHPGNVVYSSGRCMITLQKALHGSLAAARRWYDERRTQPLSVPLLPSASGLVVDCGISAFMTLCFVPLLRTGMEQIQDGTLWHAPLPEQRLQLERTALDVWVREVMELFCEVFLEREAAEFGRSGRADGCGIPSSELDAVENMMRDGTAALWLMREAMVLTLLLLWALQFCTL
ncbi:hypothetical protein TraAM80_03937 [Trypanosoma rangeli]|uniref:Uncharacterized protein n=1 Tax=Trypanosoma rangeli TaxID=5698 RepID=A0A422NLT6_TRYRA|nr:uncharacterized protein TraAM80_03937 [Trypanosoma rangeli]RNF06364.1 hypothetical protein TraAM80_03937 [Trypanosoma rangeli]|eukprot:RNF06364.1 hypothetical protein TraAM80_03937 [Trypanosoma rangeli]